MGANQSNVSIEMIEQDYPIRINEYGFVPDSAGAGRVPRWVSFGARI
jgi:N-methylhydantoinase B